MNEKRTLALRCTRCGGWLESRDDPALLACGHCSLVHLQQAEAAIAVFEPVGRIGRRRAGRIVQAALRKRGVRGSGLDSCELHYLPFWQIEGKLVGWHRFRRRVQRADGEDASLSVTMELRVEEEVLSQELTASIPACDVRSFGLMGIAERAKQLRLRPFSLDVQEERDGAVARRAPVLQGHAAALRQARDGRIAQMRRRDTTTLSRRVALVRTRVHLIYYPVWRLGIRHPKGRFSVDLDGLNGSILDGSYPATAVSGSRGWLAATACAGFVAGIAWVFGLVTLGAWLWHRLRRSDDVRSLADLAGWLSTELGAPRDEMRELGGTRGSST